MTRRDGRTFRALRHRNYRIYFSGQAVSMVGTWLQQVAMGWLAYRLTGSALLLGVIAFCANAGILFLGSFAGVLADRVDRRRAMFVTQGVLATQAALLALLTATGAVQPWHLVALALVMGVANAFDIPLRQSLYVHMIDDRADLGNAIALNSMLVNGARVVGPALAGVLLAVTGEAVCFALNALSFVAVFAALARLRFPRHEPPAVLRGLRESWVEGLRYVAHFAPARALLAMAAAVSFTVMPYASLMPVYVKDILHAGPPVLGGLLSAAGAGALASTLWLARRETVVGLGKAIVAAALAAGVALAGVGLVAHPAAALPLIFVAGGGVILAAAASNTILQTIVSDDLRGRVAGFYTLAFLGVAPLGNLAAGALAQRFGVPATFVASGLACALVALWLLRRLPRLTAAIRPVYVRLGLLRPEE